MCSQQSVTQEDKVMPITVRGCDRLAHISHIPYEVDLSHFHYFVFFCRVSTARVTDPTNWSAHVTFRARITRQCVLSLSLCASAAMLDPTYVAVRRQTLLLPRRVFAQDGEVSRAAWLPEPSFVASCSPQLLLPRSCRGS